MNFANKIFLYILTFAIPLIIIADVFLYKKYRKTLLLLFSYNIIPKVITDGVLKIQKIQIFVYSLVLLLFLLALSGPQWGIKPQEVKTYGVDVILAIDVSKSMLTEDITPNRLEFVKRTSQILLEKISTNRVGIVTFAGIAFYHCPLTNDIQAAKDLLSVIDTDIVPYPGTKIGMALDEAIRVLKQTGKTTKVIVLFTDGEDHDSEPLSFAEEAKKENIIIYTVGVGTPEGKPIPIRDPSGMIVDYKKDKQGNIITSKLNEELLYQIAERTSGRYFSSMYGEYGIADSIASELSNLKKSEIKSRYYHLYINRYYYFVYAIILLIIIDIFVPKEFWVKV